MTWPFPVRPIPVNQPTDRVPLGHEDYEDALL